VNRVTATKTIACLCLFVTDVIVTLAHCLLSSNQLNRTVTLIYSPEDSFFSTQSGQPRV